MIAKPLLTSRYHTLRSYASALMSWPTAHQEGQVRNEGYVENLRYDKALWRVEGRPGRMIEIVTFDLDLKE